nr:MAG TPA: hypothetical protein [Caudoviricetes sp.]
MFLKIETAACQHNSNLTSTLSGAIFISKNQKGAGI